ncbi:MAG: NTP/NDP exchange transporter [Betaproteobacteria bacterium]
MKRLVQVERHERPALAWSFLFFLLLLAAYYVLRPVRDAMAAQAGSQAVQQLFIYTFLCMLALVPLYGWLCARLPRTRFLPLVYLFFIVNLVAFRFFPQPEVFFVWLSVFNLFAVSTFWSLMADLFNREQATRLFGAIAAGGSCGAILGPVLTASAVRTLGPDNMLLLTAFLLLLALAALLRLLHWGAQHPRQGETAAQEALGGSILAGAKAALTSPYLLGICAYLFCYTVLSTALYMLQVEILPKAIPQRAEQIRFLAQVDLAVNGLALLVQLAFTARLAAWLGTGWMLALMPLLSLAGFAVLGAAPTLAVLVVVGVLRRAGEFAVSKPVREALYTVVSREDRYKAKSFTDTVVYRGGDALASSAFGALRGAGLGPSGLAWAALPVAAGWLAVSFWLGREQARRRSAPD